MHSAAHFYSSSFICLSSVLRFAVALYMAANGLGLDQDAIADSDETQVVLLKLPACISKKVSAKDTDVRRARSNPMAQ